MVGKNVIFSTLDRFDKAVDNILGKSNGDISRLSAEDVKRLISDFRVHLIELELENEKLQRAKLDLSESQNHYALLFDYAPVGYLVLNNSGIILEANLTLARMLGVTRIDLIGHPFIEFIHENDIIFYENYIQRFDKHLFKQNLAIHIQNFEGKFIRAELQGNVNHRKELGIEIWLAVIEDQEQKQFMKSIKSLNQKINDQTFQLIATNRDLQKNIQELASSKKELLEREAKLNSIFNAAVEGIITIDERGAIVSINKAGENIFGYTQKELMGKHINILIHNIQQQYGIDDLSNYYASKNIVSKICELEGRHKNGSEIPIDLSMAEFNIGQKRFFTCILRDVSERKNKELRDKEHLDELAHVTRLGLMGEMAAGIAHEVNQPLTAIASYLQACMLFTDPNNPDIAKLIETMQKANQQALRAGKIIHRMRDFVKSRKMEKVSTNINYLINEAMSLCETEFKQYDILCKKELESTLPNIEVDKVHIEQVLLNLIRNSIEALSKLPKEIQRVLVVQTYLETQRHIEVRIKDNGPGMDETEKNNILKPFFTTKDTGMGMGLSISRSIIEAHQGFLRYNSKKGKGSTFYFTLPIVI